MPKKFAYFLFAPGADDDLTVNAAGSESHLMLIKDFDHAKEKARWCADNGFGIIELCGWFGPERAQLLIDHTGGKIGIGYGVHFPQQDELFGAFFAPPGK